MTTSLQSGLSAYRTKRFAAGLAHYTKALDLGHDDPRIAFNAACCAALCGRKSTALQLLDTAIGLGWIDAGHLAQDEDLKSLHGEDGWPKVVASATAAEKSVRTRWQSRAFRTPFQENLSVSEKAAGIAKLWSEVKYNFVHFDQVPDLDWDAAYMESLPKALATSSTFEFYQELRRLVAKLDDAHTNVYLPSGLASMECGPGITTRLVEGQVVVVQVNNRAAAKSGLKVGATITKIDGLPVAGYAAKNVAPFLCASTKQDRRERLYGSHLLRGPVTKPIQLTVRNARGSESEIQVRRQSRMVARIRRFSRPSLKFEVLEGNIGYLQLNTFGNAAVTKKFVAAWPRLRKTDALVVDLRENGGGSSRIGWEILTYFTKQPFETTRWHTLQYRPTLRAWGKQPLARYARGPSLFQRSRRAIYDKPIVMLIGPRTFSAAEDMAAVFDQLDRGKMIGEPTGGSTGQPLRFDLPGGGSARVCTKHDFYADRTEFVGFGIQPDRLVKENLADLRKGVDTVLKAAIRELETEKK